MPKLHLPDVTLVMVETQRHLLARLAVEDCLKYVEFGEVVLCTDRAGELGVPGAACHAVPDFGSKIEFCEYIWYGVPELVRTPFALLIQWDSWVINPALWRPAFLTFDYVGPPWLYKDGLNVGNSGFNLRSKRLMDFLVRHRDTYPMRHPEDEVLCRRYRPSLEKAGGFKWAPEAVAAEFAVERTNFSGAHFGFHGTFHWPRVLEYDRLMERVAIAEKSEYIRATGMLDELCSVAPWLKRQLARPPSGAAKAPNPAAQLPIPKSYVERIRAHLLEHAVFSAELTPEKPSVRASLILGPEGHLQDVAIDGASRAADRDQGLVLKLQRASPYPKPPGGRTLRLELVVVA